MRTQSKLRHWGRHWTRELQRLSHLRTSLWRRWKQHGDLAAKALHSRIDNRIKQTVRANRRRNFNEFVDNLATVPAGQALSTVSRVLGSRRRNRKRNVESTSRIEPAQFTNFVSIPGGVARRQSNCFHSSSTSRGRN